MRKTVLLALVVLLSALWLGAQTTGNSAIQSTTSTQTSSSQQSSSEQTSSGPQTNIEGCLSGSNNNFTLMDRSGNSYQLSGDTAQLSQHVGEEVRVSGILPSTSASSSTSQTGQPGTTSQTGQPGTTSQTGQTGTATGTTSTQSGAGVGTGQTSATSSATPMSTFAVSSVKKISSNCSTGSK